MPSFIFSHQAPALALKIKNPKRFDGTALCFGSFMPDLELLFEYIRPYIDIPYHSHWGHSLIGLLCWTLPWTLLFTYIFNKYFGPKCGEVVKGLGRSGDLYRYFGIEEWILFKKKKFNTRWLIVASYSAILGGLTHLILDLPSHEWSFVFWPWFNWHILEAWTFSITDFGTINIGSFSYSLDLTMVNLIWWLETLVTLIICLYLMRYIKKKKLLELWYGNIIK